MPKVSIIMGVYNGEKYLGRAIDSILAQTYNDFEFIICNDASTDRTLKLLKTYASQDNRIIILNNEKNLGLAKSLNKCIEISTGKLIARMDDDDIAVSDRFEKQINFLDNHSEFAFVGSGIQFFNESGEFGTLIPKELPDKKDVFYGGSFMHPTIIIRKEALVSVGGYTSNKYTRRAEDYDLWCKLYSVGRIGGNLQEVLLNYYEGEISFSKRKIKDRLDLIRLKKLWFSRMSVPYTLYIKIILKEIIAILTPRVIMKNYRINKYK